MTMMTKTFTRMLLCSVLLLGASSCWAFTSTTSSSTAAAGKNILPSVPKSSLPSSLSSPLSTRIGNDDGNGRRSSSRTELHYHNFAADDHENAEPLRMSALDLERFANIKTRGKTMPIVILDSVLPGQKYYFKR